MLLLKVVISIIAILGSYLQGTQSQTIGYKEREVTVTEKSTEAQNVSSKPYEFSYTTIDRLGNAQYRKEKGDKTGSVHGTYGYFDNKGFYRAVYYTANAAGFQAQIKSNEPGLGDKGPSNVRVVSSPEIDDSFNRENTRYERDKKQNVPHSNNRIMDTPKHSSEYDPMVEHDNVSALGTVEEGKYRSIGRGHDVEGQLLDQNGAVTRSSNILSTVAKPNSVYEDTNSLKDNIRYTERYDYIPATDRNNLYVTDSDEGITSGSFKDNKAQVSRHSSVTLSEQDPNNNDNREYKELHIEHHGNNLTRTESFSNITAVRNNFSTTVRPGNSLLIDSVQPDDNNYDLVANRENNDNGTIHGLKEIPKERVHSNIVDHGALRVDDTSNSNIFGQVYNPTMNYNEMVSRGDRGNENEETGLVPGVQYATTQQYGNKQMSSIDSSTENKHRSPGEGHNQKFGSVEEKDNASDNMSGNLEDIDSDKFDHKVKEKSENEHGSKTSDRIRDQAAYNSNTYESKDSNNDYSSKNQDGNDVTNEEAIIYRRDGATGDNDYIIEEKTKTDPQGTDMKRDPEELNTGYNSGQHETLDRKYMDRDIKAQPNPNSIREKLTNIGEDVVITSETPSSEKNINPTLPKVEIEDFMKNRTYETIESLEEKPGLEVIPIFSQYPSLRIPFELSQRKPMIHNVIFRGALGHVVLQGKPALHNIVVGGVLEHMIHRPFTDPEGNDREFQIQRERNNQITASIQEPREQSDVYGASASSLLGQIHEIAKDHIDVYRDLGEKILYHNIKPKIQESSVEYVDISNAGNRESNMFEALSNSDAYDRIRSNRGQLSREHNVTHIKSHEIHKHTDVYKSFNASNGVNYEKNEPDPQIILPLPFDLHVEKVVHRQPSNLNLLGGILGHVAHGVFNPHNVRVTSIGLIKPSFPPHAFSEKVNFNTRNEETKSNKFSEDSLKHYVGYESNPVYTEDRSFNLAGVNSSESLGEEDAFQDKNDGALFYSNVNTQQQGDFLHLKSVPNKSLEDETNETPLFEISSPHTLKNQFQGRDLEYTKETTTDMSDFDKTGPSEKDIEKDFALVPSGIRGDDENLNDSTSSRTVEGNVYEQSLTPRKDIMNHGGQIDPQYDTEGVILLGTTGVLEDARLRHDVSKEPKRFGERLGSTNSRISGTKSKKIVVQVSNPFMKTGEVGKINRHRAEIGHESRPTQDIAHTEDGRNIDGGKDVGESNKSIECTMDDELDGDEHDDEYSGVKLDKGNRPNKLRCSTRREEARNRVIKLLHEFDSFSDKNFQNWSN